MTKRVHDIDAYLTIAIAALAFGLSYTKLVDLAVRAGYGSYAAHVWPLIVDGLTIVATRGVLRLTGGRWQAWALLGAGTAVSVIAAVANQLLPPGPLPPLAAAAVSVVPPLCLLVAPHLAVLLARDTRERDKVDSPTLEVPDPVELPEITPEDRRARALELLATGMSLRAVARDIGVSDTSVRKWRDAVAVTPAADDGMIRA